MTRYDPYSYGQVRLDGAPGPASAQAPDDLLFADGGNVKQAPPAADSSWSLLEEDVANLLPGGKANAAAAAEFGAEILGESLPPDIDPDLAALRPRTGPARATGGAAPPKPTAGPSRSEGLGRGAGADRPLGKPVVSLPPPKAAPRTEPRRQPAPALVRRRHPVAGFLVPLSMCAAGGTAASWVYVMQQNPVLAGILGAGTLVGALFAWLLLRG